MAINITPAYHGTRRPFIGDASKNPEISNVSDFEMRRSRYIFVKTLKNQGIKAAELQNKIR